MERYEWVVIRHPELASSIKAQEQLELAPADGQNTENNGLNQPEKPAGEISPFLSARHFNLNSKNTSMFMAGSVDSIIVGEWTVVAPPTRPCVFLLVTHAKCVPLLVSRGRWRQRPVHRLWAQPWPHWQVHHLWQPATLCWDIPGWAARGVGLPGRHELVILRKHCWMVVTERMQTQTTPVLRLHIGLIY